MAQTHLRAWRALDVPWLALHDRNLETATDLAHTYGAKVYDNAAELIRDCDVVDICLPTFLHLEAVMQVALAGKHIICEKPIALSTKEGMAMIQSCETAGVRLYIAMVLRFFPMYRRAAELALAGKLGTLQVLRLKRVGFPPHGGTSWFADDALSGGIVVDMMLHDIDYALWVAGDVVRVFARLTRTTTQQYAQAILTHSSGAITHIECGWAYQNGLFRTALDLVGDAGLLEWSSDAPPSSLRLPNTVEMIGAVPLPAISAASDPYTMQLQHAAHCLETGSPFEVTTQDAVRALNVALAVRSSALSGRAVMV